MIIRVIPIKLGYAQILSKSGLSYIQEHLFTSWATYRLREPTSSEAEKLSKTVPRQSKSCPGLQFCFLDRIFTEKDVSVISVHCKTT